MNTKKNGILCILICLLLICNIMGGCAPETKAAVSNETPALPAVSYFVNLKEESIDKESMMNTVQELTSEKYKGRLPGTEGNTLATQYLAERFKALGLESPERLDGYLQHYTQPTIVLEEKPVLQIVDGNGKVLDDFDYPENFVMRRLSSKTEEIDIQVPLYHVEEYPELGSKSKNTEGKAVLVPWKFYGLFGKHNWPDDIAKRCGAELAVSEFDLSANSMGYRHLKVTPRIGSWLNNMEYSPFIHVDSDTFAQLKDASKAGHKLRFRCKSKLDYGTKVANVVGLIPGSDPVLRESFIIIGAHFDQQGDNMDGTYNPGALDNASGVAALLEIARVIRESPAAPKQSILFIAFNGEESGLNGSNYYVKNALYPLYKSVMINLDMVGAASGIPLSIAMYASSSTTARSRSLRADMTVYADKLGIAYNTIYESGSDHTSFAYYDIPAVCLVNMDFENGYHSPYDTIEAVNGDKLKEAVSLTLCYIDQHAY